MAVWLTIYLGSDSSPPKTYSPNWLTHCSPKTPVLPSYFYSSHSIHLECPHFPLPLQILLICLTICSPTTLLATISLVSLSLLNSNGNAFYTIQLVINHMLPYDIFSIVTLNCYLNSWILTKLFPYVLSWFLNWNIRSSKVGDVLCNWVPSITEYEADLLMSFFSFSLSASFSFSSPQPVGQANYKIASNYFGSYRLYLLSGKCV